MWKLTGNRTDLYAKTRKEVTDLHQQICDKLTPWYFFNTGLQITNFHGKTVCYQGIEFEGSPRLVFWEGFIEPYLENGCVNILEKTVKTCRAGKLNPEPYLEEAAALLVILVEKTYTKMADIDQRLRGRGFPRNVQRRQVNHKIEKMGQYIREHLAAILLLETSRNLKMDTPSQASREIAAKFQRALRNHDLKEVIPIPLEELIFAQAELYLDRNMEYYQLLLSQIREKQLERDIQRTAFNITNSAIGVLNTGEMKDIESISMHVSLLREGTQAEVANAIEQLTKSVVASQELSKEQKQEMLELLETLSGQAALIPEKRLKPGAIRSVFSALAVSMNAAGGLASVWQTWGPIIKAFLGF
jgi:hypothetical protein